ncbi:phosphoribosyl-AMP cyclohydrolase [Flexibacterium corallicola]|uniref:phosphoribosyl-AMP cyclohydrolase n=1 Tax=Flexibacterium corallicola TaxID=3037259 RepID=UPI00286F906B|nr:phosphoribosyl-AMP cyclohydrolase [Pseudovibrio sp. M1P-2-3]
MCNFQSAPPLFSERTDKATVELGTAFAPKFDRDGLIAAAVSDFDSGELLMVGYMNAESLQRTIESGEAWYWSRSRQEYWRKGATSGQIQKVLELRTDCDQDALWLRVRVEGNGATCHVGYRSCFFRKVEQTQVGSFVLNFVEKEPVYDPEKVYNRKS